MPAIHSLASAVLVASLASTAVLAQTAAAPATDGTRALSNQHGSNQAAVADLLNIAASAGYGELRAARVAIVNARLPETREYARHMIEAYTRSQERLKDLADSLGVNLPVDLEALHQPKLRELEASNGLEFDRQYLLFYGIRAHQTQVHLYRQWAESAVRPEVRAYVRETIPLLEQNLRQAQSLYEKLRA